MGFLAMYSISASNLGILSKKRNDCSAKPSVYAARFAGVTCIFMNERHGPQLVLATASRDVARSQITLGRLVCVSYGSF